mmetsp:Transcript_20734/g.27986  ORF Transcript_20734/g.27986 Transcript_20734/m.27986 type:complete len:103 (-) Transcript_20734:1224-1532(-)|eukprot:CAMPEP_0185570932 /NCGR_PEP_ID=MMETSP0434-20130131/3052_1 /TAXON_ID=626734 ORGANISM="Favella taraikaensis, Strain Fe Narragansett Bay" /NCGR_SAMPLE_ID=MMETSP0434 /ASSEMBLY_ACC=CAM_ASM_000379 /LENGTH=102 /DNA_ID=CAMNT_0028186159 /DNA_START=286 /DNA_END=594 /DNA_ORIENTATION=-
MHEQHSSVHDEDHDTDPEAIVQGCERVDGALKFSLSLLRVDLVGLSYALVDHVEFLDANQTIFGGVEGVLRVVAEHWAPGHQRQQRGVHHRDENDVVSWLLL